jgi:nucleoside-diphosphate-sugar epimerase
LIDITTILRLPFVFSADDYSNRFQRLCELSLTGSESIDEPSFKYSLVRKDDAAEAIIKVLQSSPMGIIDLSNVGHITSKEILDTLNGVANQTKRNINSETESFPYFVEKNICLNSQKMTIDLSIHDALKIEAENYWRSK